MKEEEHNGNSYYERMCSIYPLLKLILICFAFCKSAALQEESKTRDPASEGFRGSTHLADQAQRRSSQIHSFYVLIHWHLSVNCLLSLFDRY